MLTQLQRNKYQQIVNMAKRVAEWFVESRFRLSDVAVRNFKRFDDSSEYMLSWFIDKIDEGMSDQTSI